MAWRWPWQERKAITAADLHLDLIREAAARSGVRVTHETVLQASTALACARVIAEGIAQVPLKLHRKLAGGGSEPAVDHPWYEPLHAAVNPFTTSYEWRETAGLHLAVMNRAYAYITRVDVVRSAVRELLPLTPQQVRTEQGADSRTRYFVRFGEAAEQEVAPERILHLRGPSWNSWEGLDGVKLAREAIGLALAAEEHGARLFSNGAAVGGVLTTDQRLTKDQAADIRAAWDAVQTGLKHAYKTAVLWGGLKWSPRAQQNDQAQWIELRRFQVQEVCRFFRVLPIMVGEADKTATYASSEQMFLAHVVHTLGPWYARIEQRLNLQLLTREEREAGLFFRFNVAGLLRGSHQDRANFYSKALGAGGSPAWMTQDEIRGLEDLNPKGGAAAVLPIPTNVGGGTPRGDENGPTDPQPA